MLTDMMEEEFDMREEEPWYDHQDLEHDLHLAAELGKNLLEKNRDLEETIQQIQETNQEQLQEIEYLSKQVDLLRSVNDQHARVYEQLDASARELELDHQRLVLENRAARLQIHGLEQTVEELQTQVEELELEQSRTRPHQDPNQTRQLHQCFSLENSLPSSRCSLKRDEPDEWRELQSLRARLGSERAQREAAEREAGALERELRGLEPRAALMGVYEGRLAEMEAEVEELRLLLRQRENSRPLPLEVEVGVASHRGRSLQSDTRHGISLLSEMDAQYVALKEKYDSLLRTQTHTHSQGENTHHEPPAYKALFRQIFTFIQKSKEDLKENRTKPAQGE